MSIKTTYQKIPLPIKLRAYVSLVRPFTLLAPMLAVIFGSWACLKYTGREYLLWREWKTVVFATVTMASAQACGQVLNQVKDVELDRINKKGYRPVARGLVTPEEAMGLGWILGLFALARGFMTNTTFGIIMGIIVFFAVFYNLEPIRAKMRSWLNVFWLGFSRGFLPMIAVWSIFGNIWTSYPWLLGSVFFVWVTGFQVTKDIPDVVGDRQFGVPTIPVKYGIENTARFIGGCLTVSMVLLYSFLLLRLLPINFLYMGFLTLPSVMIVEGLERPKELAFAENTIEWVLFYATLGGFYIMQPFLI